MAGAASGGDQSQQLKRASCSSACAARLHRVCAPFPPYSPLYCWPSPFCCGPSPYCCCGPSLAGPGSCAAAAQQRGLQHPDPPAAIALLLLCDSGRPQLAHAAQDPKNASMRALG